MTYPSICIIFDDSDETIYDVAFPYMQAAGLVGSLALRSGTVGDATEMTLAEVQEIYAAGWSVSNHTENHLDLTGENQASIESEVNTTIAYFQANGLTGSEYDLVVPLDKVDDTVLNIIAPICRTCDWNSDNYGWNSESTINKYYIRRKQSTDQTLATIKSWVDTAITNSTNIVLFFHKIESGATSGLVYNDADFQAFIDYVAALVAAGSIANITYKQLCDELNKSSATFSGTITFN